MLSEPFWPTTDQQYETFDRVSNAALAEVGLADKYHFWMEADGKVYCDPAWGDDEDEEMLNRAVNLGWEAMRAGSGPTTVPDRLCKRMVYVVGPVPEFRCNQPEASPIHDPKMRGAHVYDPAPSDSDDDVVDVPVGPVRATTERRQP